MSTTLAPSGLAGDSEVPFLDTDPPHWAARGLAYFLIVFFLVACIVAILLHLPETVSSPFTLAPIRGTDAVRTLRSGMVAEIRTSEGQPVEKGATLFVVRKVALNRNARRPYFHR